ncbi:MAG: HD domain-containing protein [Acidobacteria bacterium]|nr:HD domain-containing protein [Acidobacteriota bacterium]
MRLRWQLVLSHLGSILLTALVIGLVNVVLLLRGTRTMEGQALDSSLTTARHLLASRLADLQHARDDISTFAAEAGPLSPDIATLGRLHDFLAFYRLERVEVFHGLRKEVEAYRWERGVGRSLATAWLPPKPQIAAQVAFGRPAAWVQKGADGLASLKLCSAVPGGVGDERRWVVLTEPLDGSFLGRIIPVGLVGALRDDHQILVAWPETPPGPDQDIESLLSYLPKGPFAWLFRPVSARRPAVQLDDGSALELVLLSAPIRSGQSLVQGLRAWFLVTVCGSLLALAIGSGLAARLLAPLNALLEGTAAMARGHLMVRLPTGRGDELGSLTREFNRMADEIRNTYLGMISTLAEIVEAKSHYTREHIDRVERLAMATAEVLERRGWVRFSSHQRFLLSVAAILHDVGKIAIANEILNKSGPLDTTEREQILTHPEVGALIVERMGKLERAAEIIRCAHEHFDGSGYPRGLRGEEIPLESRIILAVDAFDAMTIKRPYSAGRSSEAAIAELRTEAGRQFDPVVVEALIEVVTKESGADVDPSSDSGLYRVIHSDSDAGYRLVSAPPPANRA